MAQRTVTLDDFDDSEPAATVRFGFEGRQLEIDLSEEHHAELRKLLAPYVERAREVSVTPSPPRRGRQARTSPQRRPDLPAIRQWALEQGLKVADRGRISSEIQEAYDRAHSRETSRRPGG